VLAALAAAGAASAGDGGALFTQNCVICHQTGAVGLAGQFPRLAGRVGKISGKPVGRAYLIDVLTYGMAGQVVVDNQPIIGIMPPFAALSAEDVASILGYVQTLDKSSGSAFTAAEVSALRTRPQKGPSEVRAERATLEKAGVIP